MTDPHEGLQSETTDFVVLLRACAKKKDLYRGTRLHADILKWGLLTRSSYVANTLVSMYAKCSALLKAQQVLQELPVRNVVSWNALITGYAQQGQGEEALKSFESMKREGLSPDAVTFICILKACGSLRAADKGEEIHDEIARQGLLGNNVVLGNALVDMYAKCGAFSKARRVLEELPVCNIVSWNALITGYVQQGQGEEALKCFEFMQRRGMPPDGVTFICILKACGSIGEVDKGQQIHDEIARQGLLGENVVLGNALVHMYAKCGALTKAQRVLEELPVQDVVSWNALIAGYAQQDYGEEAVSCFERMQNRGLSPDAVTFTCILKACGSIGAVDKGGQIHDEIVRQGLLAEDIKLGTALVDMYAKCGALGKAQEVLDGLSAQDVVSWSALILGHAQQGQGQDALNCFEQMRRKGLSPDVVTFVCVLKACGSMGAVHKGEQIHDDIVKRGLLENNIMLGNALVDMYAKCGAFGKARRVLEELPISDVVSWNALIAGYVQQGQAEDALDCFEWMRSKSLSPDEVTLTCILKACGSIGAVDKGEKIHDDIAKQGLLEKNIVLGNALVDMYSKCGALAKAQHVLEKLPVRDVVSWNTLIGGYTQQDKGEEALKCFELMRCKGVSPDEVTFTCILKACGGIGAADKGERFHDEIVRQGLLGSSVVLANALVDMYAKCGALSKARRVLDELPVQDLVSWNTLVTGYAQQGQCQDVFNCFETMQRKGLSPNAVTFSCVLNACSHSGLVDEGQMYFSNMNTNYSIMPELEHYTCMVDLFGRAGHLEKAVAMIQRMPSSDYSAVWAALLGACRKWGDVNVGRWAFDHAIQVDRSDATAYICMATIYTAAGMQDDAERIEAMRVENKAWRKAGCS